MDPPAGAGQVVKAALAQLQTRGFAVTTLRDIARDVGLGEADLRDMYGDKEGLMRQLVSPLLSSLQVITASAAEADLRQPLELRRVIEAYLDVLVANRDLVAVALGDPAALSSESIRLLRDAMLGLRAELARRRGSELQDLIRAASALGAVQAAVLQPVDVDPAVVRDVVADAAVAILLS